MTKFKGFVQKRITISLIVAVTVLLVLSIVSGFRFTYLTNDDYMMSLLIANGDDKSIFLNFFLSFLLTRIQSLVPSINCFALSQQVLCFISAIIINYCFFLRCNKKAAIFFSLLSSTLICETSVLAIQWTHTTTVVCTAGGILLYLSLFHIKKEKLKNGLIILSAIIVIVGSLYRIDSFKVFCLLYIAFIFCVILDNTINHTSKASFFRRLFCSIKENTKSLLIIVIVICLSFAINYVANSCISSNENYQRHIKTNTGRSVTSDYILAPYDENRSFYEEMGIESIEDYEMIKNGYYDKEYFETDKMLSIKDYSTKIIQNSDSSIVYVVKANIKTGIQTIKKIYGYLISINQKLPVHISNKLFVIIFGIVFIIVVALLSLLIRLQLRKTGKTISSFDLICRGLFLIIWIFYFSMRGINRNNVLILPVFIVACIMMFSHKKGNYIYSYVFSLVTIAIYSYQIYFRLSFRVSYTFLFPATMLLLFVLSNNTFFADNNSITDNGSVLVRRLALVALTSLFACPIISFWITEYTPQTVQYSSSVREYMKSNQEITYAHVVSANAVIDDAYYNSLLVPEVMKNNVIFGSWCISSDYYEKMLEEQNIKILFDAMINSDQIRILLVHEENINVVNMFEHYLTNHYSEDGKSVSLVKEEEFLCEGKGWGNQSEIKQTGIYRVITKTVE